MAQKLIIAITLTEGNLYRQNLGFGVTPVMTPDYFPPGIHADEVWIVGQMCKYFKLFKELKIISMPTTKIFTQSELPKY